MAGHRSIFGGGLAQQGFDGDQAFFGDDGLPGVVADAVGEGVEHAAGAVKGFFLALADEGDHHGYLPFDPDVIEAICRGEFAMRSYESFAKGD